MSPMASKTTKSPPPSLDRVVKAMVSCYIYMNVCMRARGCVCVRESVDHMCERRMCVSATYSACG